MVNLQERFDELEKLARAAGLDPYDVHFFHVPASIIYEIASYGLPTRYSHWTFGRMYQRQKTQGEMGMSKIYELVINNNPSYAFLDKNNTNTVNLLIAAHVFSHADYFKNNIMFNRCGETSMIDQAKRHADFIDECRKDFGNDEVDSILDIALSMERHIDVYKGLHRDRYPDRHIEYEDRTATEWEDIVHVKGGKKPLVNKTIKGLYLPPYPEKDLLWFISEYANLEPWQKKIFEIVRRESYYFYPQYRTRICNEGWSAYHHAELMRQYAYGNNNDLGVTGLKYPLTSEEHMEFVSHHEKVVQPGLKIPLKITYIDPTGKKVKKWNPAITSNPRLFRLATQLNPYYVGFRIYRDIKKRWDKYFEDGYREDEYGNKIPVIINGDQKIREVMINSDDVSLMRNYLTQDLADELKLFYYGNTDNFEDNYEFQEEEMVDEKEGSTDSDISDQTIKNKTVIVRSKDIKEIIKAFAKDHNNYGVPEIVVRRVDENGLLRLEHLLNDGVNVDINYTKQVLRYIWKVWSRPVELVRKGSKVTWHITYDGLSYEIDHETPDYPEIIEEGSAPSSW